MSRVSNATLILVSLGLAIRLILIFPGPFESRVRGVNNWADLRNYYWPAQAVLKGENPYELWATGQSGEYRADMAPLELAVYVAATAVWNDPRAIQILFALFDAASIVLIGALFHQSSLRLPFQLFYALGPLTLYNLVLVPEDKTIVLTLTFLLLWLLIQPNGKTWRIGIMTIAPFTMAVVVAGLVAAFKWLAVFYLLPLLLFVSPNVRTFVKNSLAFGGVVVLAHLPWFPSWWYVYAFRSARTGTPLHIAPAVLLNALGLFDKNILLVVLAALLGIIYALYWFKRIDLFETMALSVGVGILWTPDMDPVHLSIIVFYFLVIVDWSRPIRVLAIWMLSLFVAAIYAISTHSGMPRLGIGDLRQFTGDYGSPQMIILSYALFGLVLALYIADKLRGRAVGGQVLRGSVG